MISLFDVSAFELGFIPVATAILSLGPRNTLILRQGLLKRNVILVVIICFGCDLGLLLFATMGLGAVFAAFPVSEYILQAVGIGFLMLVSTRCFARAMRNEAARPVSEAACARRLMLNALVVSILNPLVWIETVLVIGTVASTVASDRVIVVAIGAALGSLCKFSTLGFGARLLSPLFRRPAFRRGFDTVTGAVMAVMATLLLVKFIV